MCWQTARNQTLPTSGPFLFLGTLALGFMAPGLGGATLPTGPQLGRMGSGMMGERNMTVLRPWEGGRGLAVRWAGRRSKPSFPVFRAGTKHKVRGFGDQSSPPRPTFMKQLSLTSPWGLLGQQPHP